MSTKIVLLACLLALGIGAWLTNSKMETDRESKVADGVIDSLRKRNGCQNSETLLKDLLPEGSTRVCLQLPYMSQQDFERQVGHSLSQFSGNDDQKLVWWVFRADGNRLQIPVPRMEIMEDLDHPPAGCYQVSTTKLHFQCRANNKFYYHLEEKR